MKSWTSNIENYVIKHIKHFQKIETKHKLQRK